MLVHCDVIVHEALLWCVSEEMLETFEILSSPVTVWCNDTINSPLFEQKIWKNSYLVFENKKLFLYPNNGNDKGFSSHRPTNTCECD